MELIETIIQQFGRRLAGGNAERGAQTWLAARLAAFCDGVDTHTFHAALGAKFGALKWFCLVFYLNLFLFWLALPVATCLAALNAILFVGHFVAYWDWLDFLFPSQESWNVTGTLEPVGEAHSTLLIAGHMDSVREFQWWFYLGHTGAVLTVLSGFLIALQPVFYALAWATGGPSSVVGLGVWGLSLALAPITVVYVGLHGERVVDGAIDNLSGVAVAVQVVEHFARARRLGVNALQRTRVCVVCFGSEEAGLKGSYAYARAHAEQLRAEGAVLVNVDSIKSAESLFIATSEPNLLVRYPPWLVARLSAAFQAVGAPVQTAAVTIGASDGASFARRGLPAVTIFGLNPKRLDPTYHTRLDTLANLDPAALTAVERALIQFIETWDQAESAPF